MRFAQRVPFVVFWLTGLAACGSPLADAYIQASGGEDQLEFFVVFRADRPSEVFGARSFAAGPVELTLEDGDHLTRIRVPRTDLGGRDPLLELEMLKAMELRLAAPCPDCSRVCVEYEGSRLSLPLPPQSEIANWIDGVFEPASAPEVERMLAQTRLELERVSGPCRRANAEPAQRFGAEGALLEAADQGVRIIDEDRILINSRRRLVLMMRGRDLEDNRRRTLETSALAYEVVAGLSMLSSSSTSARFLLAVRAPDEQRPSGSVVYEVEATEDGIRVVRERLRVDGLLGPLRTLPDGGFVGVGDSGLVIISRPGMPLTRYSMGSGFRLTSVESLGVEFGGYHVGGGFGFVAEGDLLAGPEAMTLSSVQRGEGLVDSSVIGFKAVVTPEGGEVWAVTRGQGVFRRTSVGVWTGVEVEAPPGVTACTRQPDACGRSQLLQIVEGVEFGPDGRLFYVPWMCPSLYTRLPTDACTQEVELTGVPKADSQGITAIRVGANRLYFISNLELWSIAL